MMIEVLKDLFKRDLEKLKVEISSYKHETAIWEIEHDILNSAGNLCLHIEGNLKTYIGNGLAKTDYVRDREFEFSGKDVSREKLITGIDETIDLVELGLSQLNTKNLDDDFPMLIWKEKTGMTFTLIHLHSHLTYHLGQVNYHRRLLDKAS